MNAPTSRLRALLSGQATGQTWRASALCAQVDRDLWFPEKGGATVRTAKAICARCPVQPDCLEYALTHFVEGGIWAGYTEDGLRRLRNSPAEIKEVA